MCEDNHAAHRRAVSPEIATASSSVVPVVRGFSRWRSRLIGGTLLIVLGLMGCASASSDGASTSATELAPSASPTQSSEIPQLAQIQGQVLPTTAEVELGDRIIGLEVARTREQQTIGLMHRERMPDDRGMLFPFSPPRPVSFWMKNVLIPLDMVFIYQGEVVAILREVPPCETEPCPTYGPGRQPVDAVIELRGGLADTLGIQIGDSVSIQPRETPQQSPE